MLWIKAFHIIFMVAWFAGIFYLPRLFVYHARVSSKDTESYQRFCTMERKLFLGIMTRCAILTLLLGVGLMHSMHITFSALPAWLAWKLAVVGVLIFYHIYCGRIVKRFNLGTNTHSSFYYRCFNEIALLLLIAIV